ncbi:MAG: acetyl-CoA hydrolase/transferase family protein [Deltaproteobacteria bacterium]|nr:MAG: acetyl-CoA hydrolase/transferase family protein [Deltaproteobacteria bacterium]
MRICTPDEAASVVGPVDTLGIPLGPGQPAALLHALGKRAEYAKLTVFGGLLVDFYALFTRPGVRLLSGFFGPVERALVASGNEVHFVPGDFRRFIHVTRQLRPRVMATCAAPPDANGRLSLSLHAGATVDELRRAGRDPERLLVVEANPQLPRTLGLPPAHPHELALDEIDILVESDRPVFALPEAEPSSVERAIAETAAKFVSNGATLQAGIGEIPDAIVRILAQAPGDDFGIHTEMFTTGLMRLHQAGKVTNRKGIYDGVSVATFALGTRELYDWLDGQELVRFLPVEAVNEPSIIARNRKMISINGALSVDLVGQIVADSIAGREHSGIGGHEDFVTGAVFSEGGRSLICLPSTAAVDGRRLSRIVSGFPAGACVTTPRHQVDVVITEYGAAELAGRTVAERREALCAIAHPAFRDALRERVPELPSLPLEDGSA